MELSITNKLQLRWALAALLVVVTLAGCRTTGSGPKWPFGRKDMEKADQLATYKENHQAVQTDGDIIPPANKAKPEATVALGERRLADSGYSNPNGPKYTESLDQLNQPPANPADNYAAVERMTAQANADASKNAAPAAYKEENVSPMDIKPMDAPAQSIASNGSSGPMDLPPVPELPPMPNADPVPAPVSPAVASDSSKTNNVIAPVQYQTEISESEAQAYTPTQGAFLPGSLDMNRFESEFSNPPPSSQPDANQMYPITPSDSSSQFDPPPLPGLSQNQNVPHELKNNFDNSRVVIVKNSRSAMTESDFCTLGYHEVASLASGNPVVAKTSPASIARQTPAEYNAIPVVQTSLVRPVEDAPSSVTPVDPESVADSAPPILMNIAPLN
ncbi:MAG: hypothetical protein IKS45_01790 [Thermoguttaceae bacterium]|nr:hypothetical protein [Thermoguttaceae bacterium]